VEKLDLWIDRPPLSPHPIITCEMTPGRKRKQEDLQVTHIIAPPSALPFESFVGKCVNLCHVFDFALFGRDDMQDSEVPPSANKKDPPISSTQDNGSGDGSNANSNSSLESLEDAQRPESPSTPTGITSTDAILPSGRTSTAGTTHQESRQSVSNTPRFPLLEESASASSTSSESQLPNQPNQQQPPPNSSRSSLTAQVQWKAAKSKDGKQ